VFRDNPLSPGFEVRAIAGDKLTLRKVRNPYGSSLCPADASELTDELVPREAVVVVADFGEPIFPGLKHLGSIRRGKDKPSHIVIKGENHHVLQALQFTYTGKVDCVYIDPPYNSGARDWKYDNNYVDDTDVYKHSKWLAFMERRLLLAKQLLNPQGSVLIVAIDEKEYLRLGLLLEQIFLGSNIQMVTTVVKPEGTGRTNEFSRTNEFLFFVMIGSAVIYPGIDNMYDRNGSQGAETAEWRNLRRRERTSIRGSRPNQFYAVFVDQMTGRIHSVGDPIPEDVPRQSIIPPIGTRAVFPLTPDGREMIWSVIPLSLRNLVTKGFARCNGSSIQFLNSGTVAAIERGEAVITGHDKHGGAIAEFPEGKALMPKTVWTREAHNAQTSGTLMLSRLIPGRNFPFPKSLYAVEDTIRFFVKNKPNAIVLDFFGGSGTTTHAVARLNRQDGGRRQSILVTNNEVSAAEAEVLRRKGLRPGDAEWEEFGIFEQITRPRITAAIMGCTPDGVPIADDYRFTDEFPIAEGFEENIEFFEITYLDQDTVELNMAFGAVAPLLWLRAGGRGPVVRENCDATGSQLPYVWGEAYGVLFDVDRWRSFVDKCEPTASTAFIVTDAQTTFAGIASELPDGIDVVRLYENYLGTFAINLAYS
jgi:adenine-specific DNA-methyltransferase